MFFFFFLIYLSFYWHAVSDILSHTGTLFEQYLYIIVKNPSSLSRGLRRLQIISPWGIYLSRLRNITSILPLCQVLNAVDKTTHVPEVAQLTRRLIFYINTELLTKQKKIQSNSTKYTTKLTKTLKLGYILCRHAASFYFWWLLQLMHFKKKNY